jgi:signal transduction histidine kinase/ActR/RegA family two-component response regulator
MSAPRTLILVPSRELKDQLVTLAEGLPWVPGRAVSFCSWSGDIQKVVADQRAADASAPIAVITDDEPAALAALGSGADEATVARCMSAAELAALVDRAETRARLRAENRRLQASFAHSEKLVALGTLVAGVGHEINNPLSAVMLSVEVAQRRVLPLLSVAMELGRAQRNGEPMDDLLARLNKLTQPERASRDALRVFEDIASAAEAIASIVRDLRVFARTDQEELPEPIEVEQLVDHAIRLVGREILQRGMIERDYAPDLPKLVIPRNRVTQVLVNVLVNAAHAIREVERPVHHVKITARADDDFLAIAISDTGPGIAPESLSRIFDPFFTTKRQELGTGLGLAISRSILRRMGGDLLVESIYGDGATFVCFLPIPSRDALRERVKPEKIKSDSAPARGSSSILLVDDDERMLRSYSLLLNQDYRLITAQDGRDAMELLESGSKPDIAIIELDLPVADGRVLWNWLREQHPELARNTIIVTGAAAKEAFAEFLAGYAGPVLHKPVRGEELLEALAALAREH